MDNDSGQRVYLFPPAKAAEIGVDGGFDHFYQWCECPECGLLDVQYGGRAARNRCGCVPGDRGHNCGSPRLAAAYEAARGARVEGNHLVLTLSGQVAQERQKLAQQAAKKKHSQRRRAQFARKSDQLMLSLIERDGYKCAVCGGFEDLTIDHLKPLSKGGGDDLDNLKIYCRACNSAKGDR